MTSMNVLSHDQIRRAAPAVFATQPEEHVSERYGFIPTIQVVEALQDQGWYPVRAQQTRSKAEARRSVARHMVRFRQDPTSQIMVGDSVPELVLLNSHDRTSAYQLDLGLFRLVCSNGMVTPTSDLGNIRVRHDRDVVGEIIEGSCELAGGIPDIADHVDRFQAIELPDEAQRLYASSVLEMRYGEDWEEKSPIPPDHLLVPRRPEDAGNSLWNTFNRVQENLMKGGVRGRAASGRRTRTRAINSVNEDVRLNRAMWKLTEHLAELMGA